MERVPASALGVRPADGASGAGGGFGFHGEAVPDAEAVEPALLGQPERRLLLFKPHGFIGLRSAAAGELGEATVEAKVDRLRTPCRTRALQDF